MAQNLTAGLYGGNFYPPVLAGLQCNGAEGSFSDCTTINGDLLNSCPSQYDLNVTYLTRQECYYNGSQYVCNHGVLYAIQVVLNTVTTTV